MDKELQKYYEARLAMMSEPAWADLMADVEGMVDATNDLASVQDEKTLHFRRGELSIMRWILSIKETSEQAYEQLKGENANT